MPLLYSILLIAIPTFAYMWIVRGIDRFEKEPFSYLAWTFFWGAIPATISAIIISLTLDIPLDAIFHDDGLAKELSSTALVAPVVEESLKGIAVAFLFLRRRHEFNGWVDGIVYGSTVGFGFAFVENILYLAGPETFGDWLQLYLIRVIVFGFMHGFWSSLTGIGFGIARNMRTPILKPLVILGGFLLAITGHMLHNGTLVLSESTDGLSLLGTLFNYLVFIVAMSILAYVAARHDRSVLQRFLYDEIGGSISPEDYEALCSTSANAKARFRVLSKQKRAFIQAAAELAQRKGDLQANKPEELERLRAQLRQYSGIQPQMPEQGSIT